MSFKVLVTAGFKKDAKTLLKKYHSLKSELQDLIASLEVKPTQGISLGNDCYKIRLAIKSKGKVNLGGRELLLMFGYREVLSIY